MSVKFTRLGNVDGSYTYTNSDGVKYEIINFKHYGAPDEWQVRNWDSSEVEAIFDTLRECREWFA